MELSHLILGRTRRVIPPPWYKGGGGGWWNPRWVFDMLQYFEMILPSVESLWSSLHDEVYFMGGAAAGGLSPNMVANLAAILDFF